MLKLMYITNRPNVAEIAQRNGVDRIIVDLERWGKYDRQRNWNSVISDHKISDILPIRNVLKKSELVVRINPLVNGTKELEEVLSFNPDYVMLPYFKTAEEVETFLDTLNGRAKSILLVETKEAVEKLGEIFSLPGIDEMHIGLNDLSHSFENNFLFESMANGVVQYIIDKALEHGIKNYGVGGVARINNGIIPAEDIICEHYRLGSTCAILSRAFCDPTLVKDESEIEEIFDREVERIRETEKYVTDFDEDMHRRCKARFDQKVKEAAAMFGQADKEA